MDKSGVALKAESLQAAYELYKQLYMEWMDFSDRIDFCAKDRGYDVDQNRAALRLISDASSNALRTFSDLNEEIEQAFNALMNPSQAADKDFSGQGRKVIWLLRVPLLSPIPPS